MDGNQVLLNGLHDIGIRCFFGVNGGGIIHLAKYLESGMTSASKQMFFTLNEYLSGFAPIGHYLATGKIAACLVTTGAAEKLVSSGASDARFMGVPAVYLLPLNTRASQDTAPMQDVSARGMNLFAQYQAEFGDDVVLINKVGLLADKLAAVVNTLSKFRPAFIFFYPDVLCEKAKYTPLTLAKPAWEAAAQVDALINNLRQIDKTTRIILFVAEEAGVHQVNPKIIAQFADRLSASVLFSVNGSNAATQTIARNLGHILLGGNTSAVRLWQTINQTDILICLGFDVGEYVLNLKPIVVKQCYCFTNKVKAYGQKNNHYAYRVQGAYHQINGNIETSLSYFIQHTANIFLEEKKNPLTLINDLPSIEIDSTKYIDLILFYRKIDALWQPNTIAFDDVCTAYRDRQAILPNPNPNAFFYTANHGSAMGSAFGLGVGAAITNVKSQTFVFSGDGCFRYYVGSMSETAALGLVVFVFCNQVFGIVKSALSHILGDVNPKRYHDCVQPIDYQKISTGMGWKYHCLLPDLTNLSEIMSDAYGKTKQSIFVEVCVHPDQVIGENYRYDNSGHR